LVEIGSVVSEEKIFFKFIMKFKKRGDEIKKKSSPLKLQSQFQPNFAEMILRWSSLKIVSVSAVLYPRSKSVKVQSSKKNAVIYVKKLIIMLIQFKFGHFLA
jgi:hypothetical protein